MKNNRIVIEKNFKGFEEILSFYLIHPTGRYYLFNQNFSKAAYHYFKDGRSVAELREYKFNKNKRLNKTISETLPTYIHYVLKYEVA